MTVGWYAVAMNLIDPSPEDHRAACDRVRSLLRAVILAFPTDPRAGSAWLHRPHPLLGTTPAAAAWCSDEAARLAFALIPNGCSANAPRSQAKRIS